VNFTEKFAEATKSMSAEERAAIMKMFEAFLVKLQRMIHLRTEKQLPLMTMELEFQMG